MKEDVNHLFKAHTPQTSTLRSVRQLHATRALANGNRSSYDFHKYENQEAVDSADPHGNILRRMRVTYGIDPVALATLACISVNQLYALENGQHALFHSMTSRNIAARRVAELMGSNWDQIVDDGLDWSHLVTLAASSDMEANRKINKELLGPNVAHIGIFKPRGHILEIVKGTRTSTPGVIQLNSEQVTDAVEIPVEQNRAHAKQHQDSFDAPVSIGLFLRKSSDSEVGVHQD
jgi:hypothetical protein